MSEREEEARVVLVFLLVSLSLSLSSNLEGKLEPERDETGHGGRRRRGRKRSKARRRSLFRSSRRAFFLFFFFFGNRVALPITTLSNASIDNCPTKNYSLGSSWARDASGTARRARATSAARTKEFML